MAGLAATGASYLSAVDRIRGQRNQLDQIRVRVNELNSLLSINGRQFTPTFNNPVSNMVRTVQNAFNNAKSLFQNDQSRKHILRKFNQLKRTRIGACDSNFEKRILKKQTPVVTMSDRVSLVSTMLLLSVSALALVTTFSQIDDLKKETRDLSRVLAGLASATGRSFPNQIEDLINESAELTMGFAPVMKKSSENLIPTPIEQDSQGSSSLLTPYFQKMPTPCFVSQRRQENDKPGATTIGSIVGGVANVVLVGVGAAATTSDLESTATGLKNLEKALVKAETNIATVVGLNQGR